MEGTTIKPALSKNLVIDSGGFIKNAPLHEFGQNLITLNEVIDEIRDKETKQRLKSLPYELQFLDPDSESIKFVTDFSKKTGDYASLSATDIKVIALTLMLEKRQNGDQHLNQEPQMKKTVEFYKPGENANSKLPVGFVNPKEDEELTEDLEKLEISEEVEKDEGIENSDEIEEESDEISEEDEDEGWITPSNFKAKKLEMLGGNQIEPEDEKEIVVACLTTDFAMQNVLKQINLHVLSAEGIIIKDTKTWILRCYACYFTTPKMDKIFCPKCGNKTLKRVSVTLNEDGSQQIHISTRRPLNNRGKVFSLPKPKGGKYAVNPILTADQQVPQQKKSAMARCKTNAMNQDYVAGNSPFSIRDVNSRSAMLGMGQGDYYWAKKNPNANGRKTGNRKKKQ